MKTTFSRQFVTTSVILLLALLLLAVGVYCALGRIS